MFHQLSNKPRTSHSISAQTLAAKGLHPIQSSLDLLKTKPRSKLLDHIAKYSNFDEVTYNDLCLELIHRAAAHCQSLPETTNSYYSLPGGILDHALNRTEAALQLFSQFLLKDEQTEYSEEQKLWIYTLFSAALLQGIGKLYTDFKIDLFDQVGRRLKTWNPVANQFGKTGQYFSYEFQTIGSDEFKKQINTPLAQFLMPLKGFAWIASKPEVFELWLALLHEDWESAGSLAAILIRADDIAIQQYWRDFSLKHQNTASPHAKPTSTFAKNESLLHKEQLIGAAFLEWLNKVLEREQIVLNRTPLYFVPGGLLLLPEVFMMFCKEYPEYKNFQVQKAVAALGLQQKSTDGKLSLNQDIAEKSHSKQGVILEHLTFLPDTVKVYDPEQRDEITLTATECINFIQSVPNLSRQPIVIHQYALKHLAVDGQWINANLVNGRAYNPGIGFHG